MAGLIDRARGVGAALLLLGLAACQSTAGGPGPLVSAPGVPITLSVVNGPPGDLDGALQRELQAAAAARRVEVVDEPGSARYRVMGYLSTEPTPEGGTAVAYVWDVFDAAKRRARRVAGSSPLPAGAKGDPWSGLDREGLRRLAEASMNEIATALVKEAGPESPAQESPGEPEAVGG